MIEIQNPHIEQFPPVKLIGKRYTNAGRVNGSYSAHWMEWHTNKWFDPLTALPFVPGMETGYIGLMRCTSDFERSFEYWIGTMDMPDSPVPEGYESIDLPIGSVAVFWLYGREQDGLYNQHENCEALLKEKGWESYRDSNGYSYFFERYNGERFADKDGTGRVILDYGFFLK